MSDAHETAICKLQFHGHHSCFRKHFQMLLLVKEGENIASISCTRSHIAATKHKTIISKIRKPNHKTTLVTFYRESTKLSLSYYHILIFNRLSTETYPLIITKIITYPLHSRKFSSTENTSTVYCYAEIFSRKSIRVHKSLHFPKIIYLQ